MIFLLKFTRWIYNTLAGAMTPNQIAYGLCLGLFVALMPMGLAEPQTIAVILLMLVTRASIWLFMLTAALLKPVMMIGLDVLPWKVGRWVLEDATFLRGPLEAVLNAPVVALFPFDRYAVMGGFLVAFALAIVLFPLIRKLVIWFRENVQPRAEQYRIVRWWRSFWFTRTLSWIFAGEGR